MQSICGADAGGCYDPSNETIVVPGDPLSDGTTKETILVHELGHNLARNRLNPPWPAVDWGTKRWATAMNVCTRTAAGTAFPGDEGANYRLNPGEALAESYRVLNFDKQTWPSWTVLAPLIVDPSLAPTPAALDALKEDVLDPWTAPTVASFGGRVASIKRAASHVVATPLDGSFSVKLVARAAGSIDLARRHEDGQGRWRRERGVSPSRSAGSGRCPSSSGLRRRASSAQRTRRRSGLSASALAELGRERRLVEPLAERHLLDSDQHEEEHDHADERGGKECRLQRAGERAPGLLRQPVQRCLAGANGVGQVLVDDHAHDRHAERRPDRRARTGSAPSPSRCRRDGTEFWTARTNTCIIRPSPMPAITMFRAASAFVVVDVHPPEQQQADGEDDRPDERVRLVAAAPRDPLAGQEARRTRRRA